MSQDAESAIEAQPVTDLQSAAVEIERRMEVSEQPQEVAEVVEEETANISPDEEVTTDEVETEVSEETETEQESEDQEPEAEESENFTYESVNDLAEATGQSIEEFLENTKITRKIDGVEEEVTLAELRNGNQRDADYRRKTTELAENRKAFEGEIHQAKEKLGQQLQEAAAITANLEQQLLSEFQSVDWNALELEDREEWLVQRQKFGERQQQIETIKSTTQQQLTEQNEQLQAQQQQSQQEYMVNQNELLLSSIPEWSDTSVRESEGKEMSNFLVSYGFSESEVGQVVDHRLVKLARDAMRNKGKTAKIEITKKKVKKLPKMIKPSQSPASIDVKKKEANEKLNRFKNNRNQKIGDIAAILESRM